MVTRLTNRRINGCQLPHNSWQKAAGVVFFGLAGVFLGVYLQILRPNSALFYGCLVVYVLTGFLVSVLTVVACLIDPADHGIDENSQEQGNYCALCRLVVHKDSKHCRSCDKVRYRRCVASCATHSRLDAQRQAPLSLMPGARLTPRSCALRLHHDDDNFICNSHGLDDAPARRIALPWTVRAQL